MSDLRAALRPYLSHRDGCASGLHQMLSAPYRPECDCGLAAALATPTPTEDATLDATALDDAYRERNAVVAALIRTNGWKAAMMPAPDAEGWWLVYAETPQGQVSWHVAPVDIRLFDGIPAEYVKWDGHTTDEKYDRIALLARSVPITESALAEALHEARFDCWTNRDDICVANHVLAAQQLLAALAAQEGR